MNPAAYKHTGVIHEDTVTWSRGGKVYACHFRLNRWEHHRSPMFTKDIVRTMETVSGRIMTLDRNKYLPDGSNNPNWYKKETQDNERSRED